MLFFLSSPHAFPDMFLLPLAFLLICLALMITALQALCVCTFSLVHKLPYMVDRGDLIENQRATTS